MSITAMSQNIKNLIGKLRFIDVFDAALLVAHDEWKKLPDSGGLSRADWTEERAANLVKELKNSIT